MLPAAIPLAWLVIVLCGRYFVLTLGPQVSRWGLALEVGSVALLTDMNLEFVAWKVRGYWIWYPGQGDAAPLWPPWQNYASWFVLTLLLTAVLPPSYGLRTRRPANTRPILILGLMNLLFACAHLLYWTRRNAG